MSLVNDFYANGCSKGDLGTLLLLLSPFAPHIAEEIWEYLGNTELCALAPWPTFDESKTVDNTVEVALQVNGKLRGTVWVAKDISKDDLLATAKADEKVASMIDGKTIVKEIVVPGKIVNIVVK